MKAVGNPNESRGLQSTDGSGCFFITAEAQRSAEKKRREEKRREEKKILWLRKEGGFLFLAKNMDFEISNLTTEAQR